MSHNQGLSKMIKKWISYGISIIVKVIGISTPCIDIDMSIKISNKVIGASFAMQSINVNVFGFRISRY